MSENIFINKERPHDSASKHVSGHAIYTDDIKEPYGTLHGAIGCSKKAHAIIKKIDLSEVWKSEGVISIIEYLIDLHVLSKLFFPPFFYNGLCNFYRISLS